jgi:energy-coupling factor transporter ATP-binding protein EcfA2
LRYGSIVITREPINVPRAMAAIEAIGGIKVHSMSEYHKHDADRTIGEILKTFVDRVVCLDPYSKDIGWIWSAFRESGFASRQGLQARLVSGCKIEELPEFHSMKQVAMRLRVAGMHDYELTRGVFALPRELRHILRCGIHGTGFLAAVDLDLQSSHPRAVLKRLESRGTEAGPLRFAVQDKARALAEIHPDREIAKELVNSLINGGTIEAWCRRYSVETQVPSWVRDLAVLLKLSAKADEQEHPVLANACKKASGLCYWLNCIEERTLLDRIEALTDAVAVSFEGDGIFFVKRTPCPNHWAQAIVAKVSGSVAPCSNKEIPPFHLVCSSTLQRWCGAHVRAIAAAPAAAEPPCREVLLTTGDFELVRCDKTVVDETCKPTVPFKVEELFDGGKGRQLVLVRTRKPRTEAFEKLQTCTLGVLAAAFVDTTVCLAIKDKNQRLKLGDEYEISTIMPTRVKLTDAKVSEVVELLFKHAHVRNFNREGYQQDFIPDFEQITGWLVEQLRCRKYVELVFECKRMIALGRANSFEKTLVKVSPAQMKEFADHFEQGTQCLRRVDDSMAKTYPRDFAKDVPMLRGVLWDDAGGIRAVTLRQALDDRYEESTLAQQRTLIFVGRASCGKTTLLRALAREVSHRAGLEVFAESTALDPFGVMTRAGLTKDIGAVCLNDFDLTTCLNQSFTIEMGKALLDVKDATSYNARYHCATLPAGRPRMWAVNPESVDAAGEPVWASWFHRSEASAPLAALVDEQDHTIRGMSESAKAIVRRAIVFKVNVPLYEVAAAALENPEQARRREQAEAASRYLL